MSKLSSLVVAICLVCFVSAAFAAEPPKKRAEGKRPSPEQIFKKLDADGDGKLTVAELAKSRRLQGDEEKAKAVLARMDENKDGTVCAAEFGKALAKRHAQGGRRGPGKEGAKAGPKKAGGEKKECPDKKCDKKE